MAYKGIADFIVKTMNERRKYEKYHGEFIVCVTDSGDVENGLVGATIHLHGEDSDTADFLIHADGTEEPWVM